MHSERFPTASYKFLAAGGVCDLVFQGKIRTAGQSGGADASGTGDNECQFMTT
jgi:hypothetical protein